MKASWLFLPTLVAIVAWVLVSSGVMVSFTRIDSPLWLIVPCMGLIVGYAVLLWLSQPISQRQIDTVYYLGFITTLAVLGTSVIRLTQNGAAADPSSISAAASHFALGLLATGVGLIGRLLLQQHTSPAENTSDALERYADAMARLSDRMDEAVRNFEQLQAELLKSARETGEKTAEAALRSITYSLKAVVDEGLKPVIEEIRGSVSLVNVSLRKLDGEKFRSLSESVQTLDKSVNGLGRGLQAAEDSVRKYRAEIDSSTTANREYATSSQVAGASFRALHTDLSALVSSLQGINHAMKSYETQIGNAVTVQGGYVKSTREAISALESNTTQLTTLVADMARKMSGLSRVVGDVNLDNLRTLGESLKAAVDQLTTLGSEVSQFSQTVRVARAAASDIQLADFAQGFQRQGELMQHAAADLGQAMARLSKELGSAIHEGLKH